ncbi:zinc ribbon domain-containing protein [uncultured Ruthenibacterium sp.]|uniref:zinc ribbon domain-containing protein n=1 Tax=uncultured Ruthenibacterium sp. TaxID=1905347 RepID=UPI00349F04FB
MICPRCGEVLPPQARFCSRCGMALPMGPVLAENPMPNPGPAPRMPDPYYAREFAAMAGGSSGRFNFAAFFLGPFHALYRGFWPRFWKLYFPWLVVLGIGQLFSCLYAGRELQAVINGGSALLSGPPVVLSWLCSTICWVLGLIVAIYNGATFNRAYREFQKGVPPTNSHVGAMLGLIASYGVWSLVLVGLVFSMVFRNLQTIEQQPFDQNQDFTYDDSAGVGYGQKVGEIFDEYTEYDQSYINGYIPGDATAGSYLDLFKQSKMFYSDDLSLYQVMSLGFDKLEVTEDVVEDEQLQVDAYLDITAVLGDTTFQFTVQQWQNYVWFVGYSCYLTEEPENVYYMSLNDLSAMLAYCYEQADGEDTASLARAVRGSWTDENGNTFKVTSDLVAGESYTLGTLIDGKVQGWLTDGGYLLMGLDETGDVLTLEYYDADGALLSSVQNTRIA